MPLAQNVFEIKYDTDLHKKIIKQFDRRIQMSRQALARRTDQWATNEDLYNAYMPVSETDATRNAKRKQGVPSYTTIAVPYSYATLLSAHTYYTSVFLSRSPVLQLQGRHGESQNAEMAIEALLDYQIQTGGSMPALYNWLLDPGKYGIGWLGHHWSDEQVTVVTYEDSVQTLFGFKTGKLERKLVEKTVQGYQGARHFNIRPQDFFHDSRVTAGNFQTGEYCIRFLQLGWNQIKNKKASGQYYNVEYLTNARQTSPKQRDTGSPRTILPNATDSNVFPPTGRTANNEPDYVNLHEFHWEIVPSEFGLSPSNSPQKWVFTIANEDTIISAQPLGLLSGMFPFSCLEHEIDAYSLWNRSLLEVIDPLNKTMEWLFNSHFYNVRAMLNNQFVVDPSKIVMKDIENPEPGKLVRLKPIAYGSDTRLAVSQLAVQDITRSHIGDSEMVGDLMNRVSGVNDTIMGMAGGGRKTATEVRTSSTFGINRLKTNCEYFSACGFSPWAQQLVQLTQQMYSADRKYRLVGNLTQWAEKYMTVAPEDIAGFYDFTPVDGTLPVDRFAQANLWQQIFQGMAKMPQVAQAYDVPKMFGFVAQLAGLKNIDQFRVQVMPDAQLQQQVQNGNLAPISQGNPQEPGQVPNLGPTG